MKLKNEIDSARGFRDGPTRGFLLNIYLPEYTKQDKTEYNVHSMLVSAFKKFANTIGTM
jgi:hypothetical protein